jgi:hypothetical protein
MTRAIMPFSIKAMHNDTQQNCTWHYNSEHIDIEHNDIVYNETHHLANQYHLTVIIMTF